MRRSRRNNEPKPGPSSAMDVDDSGSDEEQVSQVSKSMKKINVSKNGQKARHRIRLADSDSDTELEVSKSTQKMNGSVRGQKGKAHAVRIESESEEEPQPSTSQASQKRRKHNASQKGRPSTSQANGDTMFGEEISASQISPDTSLTEQEFEHHVANVVKYILAADHTNVPFEKTNMAKAVNYNNKLFKDVFKAAQDILLDVFGYVLLDVENDGDAKKDAKNQAKTTKPSKYILINTIQNRDLHEDINEEDGLPYILLFLVLSHIFMSGDKCSMDSLTDFLKKLEIVSERDNTRHEFFGDAIETLKDFVKEKYIEIHDDEVTWGVRATKELKPRQVMEFVSEMYGGKAIESWTQEYERLRKKEQEENNRPNGQVNGH